MRIQTLPYADLLVDGDEALVLLAVAAASPDEQGGTIARLSAIGATVLQLAEPGIGFDELAAALEARFGAPPAMTTAEALPAVLDALAAQRLVDLSHDKGSEE